VYKLRRQLLLAALLVWRIKQDSFSDRADAWDQTCKKSRSELQGKGLKQKGIYGRFHLMLCLLVGWLLPQHKESFLCLIILTVSVPSLSKPWKLEDAMQRDRCSILGDIQGQTRKGSEQRDVALGVPVHCRELDYMTFNGPFQLRQILWSYIRFQFLFNLLRPYSNKQFWCPEVLEVLPVLHIECLLLSKQVFRNEQMTTKSAKKTRYLYKDFSPPGFIQFNILLEITYVHWNEPCLFQPGPMGIFHV